MEPNIKRLEELLDLKDQQLEKLKEKLEKIKTKETEKKLEWCTHDSFKEYRPELPLPRLELGYYSYGGEWYNMDIYLFFVYKAHYGEIVRVPIEMTTRGGGTKHIAPSFSDHSLLPFRSGEHIISYEKEWNMPAYVIINMQKEGIKDPVCRLKDTMDYKNRLKGETD